MVVPDLSYGDVKKTELQTGKKTTQQGNSCTQIYLSEPPGLLGLATGTWMRECIQKLR